MSSAPTQPPQTAAPSAAPANGPSPSGLDSLQAVAAATGAANQLTGLDPQQILALLRHLPVFNKQLTDQGKEAAETLSNLSQSAGPPPFPPAGGPNHPQNQNQNIHPELQGHEPGPNSHPNGPPMMGMQQPQDDPSEQEPTSPTSMTSDPKRGRRSGPPTVNGTVMGSEEWSRQRKDNHKEVERRRRGNINEGINELARIVPNGTGEKAKGAILSRSVQYIHHLKDNEARNIEKWTLEKLLMDQAMGDLQSQLEEVKRMWEEERRGREKAEAELATLRSELALSPGASGASTKKRASAEAEEASENEVEKEVESGERGAKRQKVAA